MGNLKASKSLSVLPLDQISREHLTAFVEATRAEPVTTATINRDLATLRRMLNRAEEWGVIHAARHVKLLPGENQRERVISAPEEYTYLAACPSMMRVLALIMLDCGLRSEECHKLRWAEHIKAEAG